MTREEVSFGARPMTRSCARTCTTGSDVQSERDGPLLRTVGFGSQGWVEYRDLAGLEGPALDTLIARQVRFFAERGERFEWKYHGHDLPADLPERLRAAGFVPEETETVGSAGSKPSPPSGGCRREWRSERCSSRTTSRIARLEASVWGGSTTAGRRPRRGACGRPGGPSPLPRRGGDLAVCAG